VRVKIQFTLQYKVLYNTKQFIKKQVLGALVFRDCNLEGVMSGLGGG